MSARRYSPSVVAWYIMLLAVMLLRSGILKVNISQKAFGIGLHISSPIS